jgi:hypothetical protein
MYFPSLFSTGSVRMLRGRVPSLAAASPAQKAAICGSATIFASAVTAVPTKHAVASARLTIDVFVMSFSSSLALHSACHKVGILLAARLRRYPICENSQETRNPDQERASTLD